MVDFVRAERWRATAIAVAVVIVLTGVVIVLFLSSSLPKMEGTHRLRVNIFPGSSPCDDLLEPVHAGVGDINGDGLVDLIIANGRDQDSNCQLVEPLVVYFNRGSSATKAYAPFANPPSNASSFAASKYRWKSDTLQRYTQVCPLDANGDGCLDVAAARIQTGDVPEVLDLYLNTKTNAACTGLGKSPSVTLKAPYAAELGAAWSCAVGDLDADGDDDLGLAVAYADYDSDADSGSDSDDGDPLEEAHGFVMVYAQGPVDANGKPVFTQAWKDADNRRHAFDLEFSDMDLDGRIDLVGSMEGVRVYRGNASWFNTTTSLDWSIGIDGFTAGIDTNWLDETGTKAVVVAVNNWTNETEAGARNVILEFAQGALTKVWDSEEAEGGAWDDAAMLELDSIYGVEVAGVRWTTVNCSETYEPDEPNESASIFWNSIGGSDNHLDLGAKVNRYVLGQAIFPWEFSRSKIVTKTYVEHVSAGTKTVSFHGTNAPTFVMNVTKVVNAAASNVRHRFTPGNDWVAILDPPSADDTLTISYTTSATPDLVVVDGCGYIHFFQNK